VKNVADDTSLARLFGLLKAHNSNLHDLLHVQTESEFIAATEVAIERAMKKIENGSKEYSTLSEPGLSHLLADFLDLMGWRATAETNNNGHVDVVVEDAFKRHWRYLGECKMHDGYQHHVNGCEQLLGYCTGRERRAFCMDFIDSADAFKKMKKLRNDMDKKRPLKQKAAGADHPILGAFLTGHDHATGAVVEILHLACSVPKP
jgi:methionine synthase II (cobalamin-independent)